jgi:serine protease Do
MAIGNPYGLQGSVTVGVISGVHRSNLGIATYENFLQTDAAINPGNSGGPLINLSGEIVGINTSVTALGSGVGFAIPIDIALRISGELMNNGSVQRGWIGVGVQEMTPALFWAFKIHDSKKGILVNNVENNAPAKKAGIMRGDIVLKYNGRHVRSVKNFQSMVADTQIGKQVFIDVIRDGLEKTLLITIGELTS